MSPFYALFFFFFLLLPFFIDSSYGSPISLSLHSPKFKTSDPYERLTHLATASLTRAQLLKKPPASQDERLLKTPLFPHSYGGYSISLNFGTPPQKSSLIMDTGSELVWIPCTKSYACQNCSFPNHSAPETPPFIPKSSTSSKIIGCSNPKCNWLYDAEFLRSKCPACRPNARSNCSQICPTYLLAYGSGWTIGILLSETLGFPEKQIADFGVGCSIFSARQPAGIAGFGRGPSSLPSQLRLSRFSYCLVSHRFDDSDKTSEMVLDGGSDSGDKAVNVSYTPFLKNPLSGTPPFSVYYYLSLRKIAVGGKSVKVPYQFLKPGKEGSGGTIVDSGTTFTFMEGHVFDPVAREFVAQVGSRYNRATDVESITGLRPCFNVTGVKSPMFPKLAFHFKGGAQMDLPLANYLSFVGDAQVVCMTIVTDDMGPSDGPTIILGNFQQQNFYTVYDLKKERFGFRHQSC